MNPNPLRATRNSAAGRVTHIGYRDLSGQLRSALEDFRFGGMSLIPFSWVAVLIVIYIVLIGPVDYLFLRRIVRRMEFTWITFPLVAVIVGGVAVLLTGFYKGDQFAVRQLAVIDHDLTSGSQRQMLWAHAYSPANDQYDMTLTGEANRLLCWHGLPGTALGGMQTPAATASDDTAYNYIPADSDPQQLAIEQRPFQSTSGRPKACMVTHGQRPTRPPPSGLAHKLASSKRPISG